MLFVEIYQIFILLTLCIKFKIFTVSVSGVCMHGYVILLKLFCFWVLLCLLCVCVCVCVCVLIFFLLQCALVFIFVCLCEGGRVGWGL